MSEEETTKLSELLAKVALARAADKAAYDREKVARKEREQLEQALQDAEQELALYLESLITAIPPVAGAEQPA